MKMTEAIKRIVKKNAHEYNVLLRAIKQGEGSELLPGLKMVNMFINIPARGMKKTQHRFKQFFSEKGAGI